MNGKDTDSGYDRLENQIEWYDKKSGQAQFRFKTSKICVIIGASLIPISALLNYNILSAIIGAGIAVIEGVQHLNQWNHNWITYRSTCEALRHEKFAYIGKIEPYFNLTDEEAKRLLIERVESLISTEHSKWISTQEKVGTVNLTRRKNGNELV